MFFMVRSIQKGNVMEKGPYFMMMEKYMKESFKITKSMGWGLNYLWMVQFIQVLLLKISEMEKVDLNGQTVRHMMGSG